MKKQQAKDIKGTGCMVLFALPFAGVGVFMAGLTVVTLVRAARISKWEEVPATIEHAKLENHSDSDGSSYKTTADYRYAYDDKPYRGSRVSIHGGADGIGSFQKRIYKKLNAHAKDGTPFRCFVNPTNPQEAILYRQVRWEMIGFFLVFALVFGGVGFGLMIGAVYAGKKVKREAERKTIFGGEPWLWKEEWAGGEIRSSNKGAMIGALIFAGLWNTISVPIALLAIRDEVIEKGNKMALLVLLFPLVGVPLVIWAVRTVIQWRKFGTAVFKMAALPGVIGGKLAGVIQVPVHVEARDGFTVMLSCVNKVTSGSGKNRRTRENILWQDRQHLARELFGQDLTRTAIPVLFGIPYNSRASDDSRPNSEIIWRLEAKAETPGVDFASSFDVPVFKTPESSPDFVLDDRAVAAYRKPMDRDTALREAGFVVMQRGAASTEFYLPPARALGSAFGITVFTAFWLGAIVLMIKLHAPLLFPIVFSLFGILIAWGAVDIWLAAHRVIISHHRLTVRGGLLALGREIVVTADEIDDFQIAGGMQSGNRVFYSIKLKRVGGKPVTLGKYIPDRKAAELSIEAMKQDLTG